MPAGITPDLGLVTPYLYFFSTIAAFNFFGLRVFYLFVAGAVILEHFIHHSIQLLFLSYDIIVLEVYLA